MPANKLTDNEIKTINIEKYATALNNLIGVDSGYFTGDKDVDAIVEIITIAKKQENLINRLQAKVIKEQNKNSKLRNERNRLQAENEELEKTLRQTLTDIREAKVLVANDIKTAKTEAYKECVEKVKERYKNIPMWGTVAIVFMEEIYKELVGEDK